MRTTKRNKKTSYTFTGLKDGKTYNQLKMKAVDYAKNEYITKSEITITPTAENSLTVTQTDYSISIIVKY